jgi:hypothetical protein
MVNFCHSGGCEYINEEAMMAMGGREIGRKGKANGRRGRQLRRNRK